MVNKIPIRESLKVDISVPSKSPAVYYVTKERFKRVDLLFFITVLLLFLYKCT